MLEQAGLRLTPWIRAALPDPDVCCPVRMVHGLDDALLGFVRETRGPAWLGCGPRRLDVCETEDAALLMSIEHGWFGFGKWRVLDAEESRVGGVVGNHLLDEQGSRFATLRPDAAAVSIIRDRQNRALARLETDATGNQILNFAENLEVNPFLRMVLLACAIVTLRVRPTV